MRFLIGNPIWFAIANVKLVVKSFVTLRTALWNNPTPDRLPRMNVWEVFVYAIFTSHWLTKRKHVVPKRKVRDVIKLWFAYGFAVKKILLWICERDVLFWLLLSIQARLWYFPLMQMHKSTRVLKTYSHTFSRLQINVNSLT